MIKDNLFSILKEHESSIKHVTGKAKYTDDIPEPKNLLYGAIGWSKISKGKILKIDLTEVLKSLEAELYQISPFPIVAGGSLAIALIFFPNTVL